MDLWLATQVLEAAGVEEPRFTAQLLLAHVLGVRRVQIIAQTYPPPTLEQWEQFAHLIHARADRVPLPYLRGFQEFYGLEFDVTPSVLIPRPETEMLVEFVRERCVGEQVLWADVGTGSGCIAISALYHCPNARCIATDISHDALIVASRNAATHRVQDRLHFVETHVLRGVSAQFDMIVSNPPYIARSEADTLQPEVRDFEPSTALFADSDGLSYYMEFAATFPTYLKEGGWLAVEVGVGQAQAVAVLFQNAGLKRVAVQRDLARIERVVVAQKE